MKALLTDRFLRGLRPAQPGKRTVVWDAAVPGLNIRVTDTGNASANVMARVKGQALPIRVPVGFAWKVPLPAGVPLPLALSDMRKDARTVRLDMARRIDPKAKALAEREAETAATRGAFDAVAEDFIASHVAKLRSAKEMAATIHKDITPVFGRRPIVEIAVDEIAKLIKDISKKRPSTARNVYHRASKLWSWAVAQRCYGLVSSPFAVLAAKDLLGRAPQRDRVLTDSEQAAVWRATEALPYPSGPVVRLLQLTGLRLREVAELSWSEIDLDKALLTISADRMKNGAVHVLPLAPMALAILESLPGRSGFVFSTTNGAKPISFFSKLKKRIDAGTAAIEPWTFHDLRRSLRTGLSMLGVPDVVSELVLAHSQKGLHKTYDRHAYLNEKLAALTKWEAHLRGVVEPSPDNVIQLAGGRHGK